jgi:hypothetical protein
VTCFCVQELYNTRSLYEAFVIAGRTSAAPSPFLALTSLPFSCHATSLSEETFGYLPSEVVGQNISMLMKREIAIVHDNFLSRYLATKEAHVVGKQREVGFGERVVRCSVGPTLYEAPARYCFLSHALMLLRPIGRWKTLFWSMTCTLLSLVHQSAPHAAMTSLIRRWR